MWGEIVKMLGGSKKVQGAGGAGDWDVKMVAGDKILVGELLEKSGSSQLFLQPIEALLTLAYCIELGRANCCLILNWLP